MYKKLHYVLRNLRLFEKRQSRKHHLIIIDGPTAISVSKLLADNSKTLELRFIASPHFLALLDAATTSSLNKRMVGWLLSEFLTFLFRYLVFLKWLPGQELNRIEFASVFNRERIGRYIEKNAQQISSVIVFNERNPSPAFAIAIAKKSGIKTACIQHGAIVENYFPVHVDCYFTWSDYYSQLLQNRTPGLKTICVGRLGYEAHDVPGILIRNKPLLVLQPANVSIKKPDLLLHFQKVIDVCYQFFDEVILRPHPSDNILPDIVNYIGERPFIVDTEDLGVALSSYKITISLYSTVLYEAPLFGSVPVQYLETHLGGELFNRCELLADTPEQLYKILNNLKEKSYFDDCRNRARLYSEVRMVIGDIDAFFYALTQKH